MPNQTRISTNFLSPAKSSRSHGLSTTLRPENLLQQAIMNTSTSSRIASIPSELQLEIFSYLDPVSSTCLGLTCKKLYSLSKKVRGATKLNAVYWVPGGRSFNYLGDLLEKWAGQNLEYPLGSSKFHRVRVDRRKRLATREGE
ncbi:hypothetical protein BGZ57DRAFT_930399 [Hyaloscypha finlandica]|nr:hypothetical protein BGZ57DRAFT_930399 [Hyaloscypha finlandica]